jgi:hypothetical protein
MDREEEKPKAFKIDDRRRFSLEGELKPEHRGADEESVAGKPVATPSARGSEQLSTATEPSPSASAGAAAAYSKYGGPAQRLPSKLSSLVSRRRR